MLCLNCHHLINNLPKKLLCLSLILLNLMTYSGWVEELIQENPATSHIKRKQLKKDIMNLLDKEQKSFFFLIIIKINN